MMQSQDSSLDAETKSIIEGALTKFIDDAYQPAARRARLASRTADDRACWPVLAELGLLGFRVNAAYGGIGASARDLCDVMQVLARGLLLEPLIEAAIIPTALLGRAAGAEAALADLMSGQAMTVLLGGRRGDELRISAVSGGYAITGTARVAPGAAQADMWLVACQDDNGGWKVLQVRAADTEARLQSYRMMDGRQACDVEFTGARVAVCVALLEGQAAASALAGAAAAAIGAYAAEAAGVMQNLVSMTSLYLRSREQFGVPLATFQALQHRLADMHIASLEACAMATELAKRIDRAETEHIDWLRYVVPVVVSRCGARVGHDAIQLHGGMGVTDELVISHCNSRLVVLNELMARWAAAPAVTAPLN